MAHFAELDENNNVINAIVVHNNELLDENGNESEQKGIDFCVAHYGGRWVQTSYNGTFRKRYAAGIGFKYDPINDVFLDPQPFPSWTLSSNFDWEPPVPFPAEPWLYSWNEATRMWDERL